MTEFVDLQFQSNYGKPLQAAKEGKCSSKEAEAGVLAMEALHKQVLHIAIVTPRTSYILAVRR